MLTKEQKAYILSRIESVLKPLGYKKRKRDAIRFYRSSDEHLDFFLIFFLRITDIRVTGVYRGIREVEAIMARLYDDNYPIIGWIRDFGDIPFSIDDRSLRYISTSPLLNTQEEIDSFCDWYIGYLLGDGMRFFNHYSYLPNILKRMDELEAQGLPWQHPKEGILSGSLDGDFRGLIISKLCNDPHFEHKVAKIEREFHEDESDKPWWPYLDRLKEILPTIEPKYNI